MGKDKEIPEVAIQSIGIGAHPDGRNLGIEIRDEHGGAVRLWTEAINVPSLISVLLGGANELVKNMDPGDVPGFMAAQVEQNILQTIPAMKADATTSKVMSVLRVHTGGILLQFELPTEELRQLANKVLAELS